MKTKKPKFKKKELHDKLLDLALYNVVKEGLAKALENVEDYGNEPEVVENVMFSTYSDIRDKIRHLKHYNKLTKRKFKREYNNSKTLEFALVEQTLRVYQSAHRKKIHIDMDNQAV